MIISLPTEIEKIVTETINSGAYQSADEVISKSVRLLDAKEKGTKALRREIMRGFEDIQQERFTIISSDEELDAFSDEIIRQAKKKRDASKNNRRIIWISKSAQNLKS